MTVSLDAAPVAISTSNSCAVIPKSIAICVSTLAAPVEAMSSVYAELAHDVPEGVTETLADADGAAERAFVVLSIAITYHSGGRGTNFSWAASNTVVLKSMSAYLPT